jgi:uncharacterized protein YkwD
MGWVSDFWNWLRGRKPAPAPPPTPNPTLTEVELLRQTNLARTAHNLPALTTRPDLASEAVSWAWSLARADVIRDYPLTDDVMRRLRLSDAGANVAWGQRTAAEAVQTWLSDADHRRNQLGPWTVCGFGAATAASGRIYWVALFGRP